MRSLGVDLPEQPHQKYTDIQDVLTATRRHESPGATLSPGRRGGLRGGGAGVAAVSPQRWLQWYIVHKTRKHEAHRGWQSASSTSIFKHRTQRQRAQTHTQRHKNWEGWGGGGGGGGATQTILLQNNNSFSVPTGGDGAALAGSPPAPLSAQRGGGGKKKKTTKNPPHAQPPPTPPPQVRLAADTRNAEFATKMN